MNIEQYPVISTSSHLYYKFYSIGPKGIIKKFVQFKQIGINLYNLSIGDWNERKGIIDDSVISNNLDTLKVLNTVAHTVILFIDHFPKAEVLIIGSTNARTRLYQMSISRNIIEIQKFFDFKGFKNRNWEEFRIGTNYDAFRIKNKIKFE